MGAWNRPERNRDPWRQTTLVARKHPFPAAALHHPDTLNFIRLLTHKLIRYYNLKLVQKKKVKFLLKPTYLNKNEF